MILALLAAAALATPAPADRVHTVAGGGAAPLREGVSATAARLRPTEVTVRDDGTITIVDRRRLWSIGSDGRLHAPPAPLTGVTDIDAEPGGALLAVAYGQLFRLEATAWRRVFAPPPAAADAYRPATAESVTHMSGGRILLGGSYRSWILDHDGQVIETLDVSGDEGVAAWPDGGIALLGNPGLRVRRPGGVLRAVAQRAFDAASGGDLVALPDGSLLAVTYGDLLRVDRRGHARALYAPRYGLGAGDGGPLRRAVVNPSALALGPRGELALADNTESLLRGRFAARAAARRGGWETLIDTEHANLVRVVRPAASRALVTITPSTYRTFARGVVTYRSTFAGVARLTVDGAGHVDFRARAGSGEVRLARPPTAGDHRLTLVVNAGARTATGRLAVSTRARLDLRAASGVLRAAAADQSNGDAADGVLGDLRQCTVRGPLRLDCGLRLRPYSETVKPDPPYCGGVFSARQRPDGIRFALLRARRGSHCRAPTT